LRAATAEVFAARVDSGAARFERWGYGPAEAREALTAAASAVTAAIRAAQEVSAPR
jgi:hypothetical protein